MIVKILGAIDLIIALILFLSEKFAFIPQFLIITIGFYLVIKSLIFIWTIDLASIIEIIIGIVILASVYISVINLPHAITYAITVYFTIKGIFSMIG